MPRTVSYRFLACIALSSTAAHADFAVRNDQAIGKGQDTPQSMVAAGVVADDPHVDPGDREPPARPEPAAVRPRPVEGFGDQVPLSFACRQIVPKDIKVSYEPGVDPTTPVTWKGGDIWPLVLGRAIRPLGLRMVEAGAGLRIRR